MKKILYLYLLLLLILIINYYNNNSKIDIMYNNWVNRLLNNINHKGIFNYHYNIKNNIYDNKNNEIRQFLASRILAELSNNNDLLKEIHKKNLDFIFKNRYFEKWNYWYIKYNNKSKIWANSLIIRVLIYSPFFDNYKNKIEKLINWIYLLQENNWKLKPWLIEPNYKYNENYLMYFYSWETILTFLELYEKTWNVEYYNFAKKSQDYYYNEYITNIYLNYYPAYVPWHTFSMSKFFEITKEKKYLDAIFLMNDKLIELQDNNINSKTFWRFFKTWFEKYWTPHSSSDSIYTESLIYAYDIANKTNNYSKKNNYSITINNSLTNLSNLQYSSIDNSFKLNSEKYLWWLKTNINNLNIRVDNNTHFIDMLTKYKEVYFSN